MDTDENLTQIKKMPYASETQLYWPTELHDRVYLGGECSENYFEGDELASVFPNDTVSTSNLETAQGESSSPKYLESFNNKLYFQAEINDTIELFSMDILGNLTKITVNECKSSNPTHLTAIGDHLYFSAITCQTPKLTIYRGLFSIDNSNTVEHVSGSDEIEDLPTEPIDLIEFGGKLYFNARAHLNGRQLFVYDPVANITTRLTNNYYGSNTFAEGPNDFIVYDNALWYHQLDYNNGGQELWKITNTTTSSIDLHNNANLIDIYPNPTSNQLTIASEQNISEINIIDITGKIIMISTENLNAVNVADLLDGIYFIQLITEERRITKKFVKQ